jgi:hypothetical protein
MHGIFAFLLIAAFLLVVVCKNPAPNVGSPTPLCGPSAASSSVARKHGIMRDMADPNHQFPGKPYYGDTHTDLLEKAKRDYWFWDVDKTWRDGMMPRPPHEPNQMVSMPY